jgi:hypothetical protein
VEVDLRLRIAVAQEPRRGQADLRKDPGQQAKPVELCRFRDDIQTAARAEVQHVVVAQITMQDDDRAND